MSPESALVPRSAEAPVQVRSDRADPESSRSRTTRAGGAQRQAELPLLVLLLIRARRVDVDEPGVQRGADEAGIAIDPMLTTGSLRPVRPSVRTTDRPVRGGASVRGVRAGAGGQERGAGDASRPCREELSARGEAGVSHAPVYCGSGGHAAAPEEIAAGVGLPHGIPVHRLAASVRANVGELGAVLRLDIAEDLLVAT